MPENPEEMRKLAADSPGDDSIMSDDDSSDEQEDGFEAPQSDDTADM